MTTKRHLKYSMQINQTLLHFKFELAFGLTRAEVKFKIYMANFTWVKYIVIPAYPLIRGQ